MLWFGFGYRGFGQLGSGEELTLNLPQPVQAKGTYLENKQIFKAVPSWSFTAFLTDEGLLLLSGCIGGSPQQIICFSGLDCRDVLPSEKYLIVLIKGRAECWDVNTLHCKGTLPEPMWKMELSTRPNIAFPLVGKGYVLPQPPFFRELPSALEAQKMALGNEHAVLLTSDGTVLTWGAGRHGQLGHGDVEDVPEPRIVEALHGVVMSQVAAGGWHTVSISGVTSEDRLTGCDIDKDSEFIAIQSFPALIDLPQEAEAAKASCGSRHTAAVTRCGELYTWGWESGDLYCWGWNESGQLGLPSKALQQERVTSEDRLTGCDIDKDSEFIAIQSFPALIDLPQEAEAAKASCGSRHTAAVTRCGELYTWGWGKYGQLGHGDTKNLDQPKRVEFFNQHKFCVKDVTCRHWNTYVMCVLDAK
ncbi:RCC1 domain-containing protein 1 isoform X2 [Rhinoderma darwinii]|uniref:RCC1 domain-containing protein 1 isoform X2 n=1 Tax=Rhinoderma darwinii TaxID=43563 RepID=UPI003F66B4EA